MGVNRFGLTDVRKSQAKHAGERLKELLASEPDVASRTFIVTSDFKRARETAEIIHSELAVRARLETDCALRERNMGYLDMKSADSSHKLWARDIQDPTQTDYGNESVLDVIGRTTGALRRHCGEHNGAIVLMVTHGDPALILRGAFLGVAPENIRNQVPYFENCDIVELGNN